jgi:hypothetical protein
VDTLVEELRRRFQSMFTALAQGADVPPAAGLRAEGLMEATVLAEQADAARLDRLMAECYREAVGRELSADLGADWRSYHPFPEIPLWMHRAPVVPSTGD